VSYMEQFEICSANYARKTTTTAFLAPPLLRFRDIRLVNITEPVPTPTKAGNPKMVTSTTVEKVTVPSSNRCSRITSHPITHGVVATRGVIASPAR
jgi:hypothetical protein